MSDSQQKQNEPHLLLNTVLITLETVFTLVLKHDQVIGLQAKKFIDQKVSIKINSYIPFFSFYIHFNQHGILFDADLPTDAKIDLDVRTSFSDLLKIIMLGNAKSIRAMRIDGDTVLQDEFRDLLLLFSVPKILADWKQWFKSPISAQNLETSNKRIAPLLDKIDVQRSKINALKVEVKQYKNRVRHLKRQQKQLNYFFCSVIVLLMALLVYNLWL